MDEGFNNHLENEITFLENIYQIHYYDFNLLGNPVDDTEQAE